MFDLKLGTQIGQLLLSARKNGPENIMPRGLSPLEYRKWLTVVIALDYLKDADKLWTNARNALEDDNYLLFEFWYLRETPEEKLAEQLLDAGLSIFPNKDAKYLKLIAKKMRLYVDDPLNILQRAGYKGDRVLLLLKEFPYLRGKKLSLFWLRVMHDLVEPKLDISMIDIPVDVHVARFSFRTGILIGNYNGTVGKITEEVQAIWYLIARELKTYPCIFDEPIWTISKYICMDCDNCILTNVCKKLNVNVTSASVEVQK